jgi:hypothetical protein
MSSAVVACAWVESPLQLLCVVEYAAHSGTAVRVIPRANCAQLPATAARLIELGLPDGVTIAEPRHLPLDGMLGPSSRHWIIGDAFSGVARSALALRMPHRLTIVDDGSASLGLDPVLAGFERLARRGDAALAAPLAELATARLRALAARGGVELFSYYALRHESLVPNRFAWLRSRELAAPAPRHIILGSAGVVDGLIGEQDYLGWLAGLERPSHYLPHRRETPELRARVAALSGVEVVEHGIPVELALAGARGARISSLASSAVDTLRIILEGSASTIHLGAIGHRSPRERSMPTGGGVAA